MATSLAPKKKKKLFLRRFTRSSGCLSFPGTLLHSGWLSVSLRYHSEEKTATVICFTEKECTEAVFRTLLRFAPMLRWFTNKMARQTVFATAVGFHGQSCRSDKLHMGKQGSCSLPPHTHSLTVTAGMSVTLTNSAQVNAVNMAGAGAWRLCSSKTEESTAQSSWRPEAKISCSLCLSSVVDTGEQTSIWWWHHTRPRTVTSRH